MKKILLFSMAIAALTACQESLEDKAAREASDYTQKNCPLWINQFQVMDSFTFDRSTHTFGYHYRLTGTMDTATALSASQQRATLIDGVRNTPALKAYKDEGYAFRYTYRSTKNPDTVFVDTTIKPEDYR